MTTQKKTQRTRIALALFQAFNGISALFGGWGLVNDPSGDSLQMDLSLLNGTPFRDFLIPGIILLVVNGIGNAAGFFATIRKYTRAGDIGLLFGIIMVIWILVQVILVGYQSILQPIYLATGLIQGLFGYLYRTQQQQSSL